MRRRINLLQGFVLLLLVLCATAILFAVSYGMIAGFGFVLSNKKIAAGIFLMLVLLTVARVIWLIVRWINRRDDPCHTKRPPDPP